MSLTLPELPEAPAGAEPAAEETPPSAPPCALWESPPGPDADDSERAEAERLLRSLWNSPVEAVERQRFQSRRLARLLLEKSYAEQRLRPEKAEALAGWGASLASAMLRPAEDDPWLLAFAGCAWCLAASARRRLGRLDQALAALPKAAYFLGLAEAPAERALYLRVAGLVHWEQGRLDEAEALFSAAAGQAAAAGRAGDEAAALVLWGLLYAEEGQVVPAVAALETALPLLPVDDLRVPVAAEGGLVLAACLAEAGEPARALAALETARGWLPRLKTSWEHVRSRWLEARAWLSLGDARAAGRLFRSAEDLLYEERDLPNAFLLELDELPAEVERGGHEAPERRIFVAERRNDWPGKDLALTALARLKAQPPDPRTLRATATGLARGARHKLRFRQVRVESPPFTG